MDDILGKTIKKQLDKKGMSQREFIKKIGINEANFSKYLKGEKTPQADTLIKIAKGLDCSLDYLLGLSKSKYIEPTEDEKAITRVSELTGLEAETIEGMIDLKDGLKIIINKVSYEDRLIQLAEECNELSQAILKWYRLKKGTNPPAENVEVFKKLYEELADVSLCLKTVINDTDISPYEKDIVQANEDYKLDRWVTRIESRNYRNTR